MQGCAYLCEMTFGYKQPIFQKFLNCAKDNQCLSSYPADGAISRTFRLLTTQIYAQPRGHTHVHRQARARASTQPAPARLRLTFGSPSQP